MSEARKWLGVPWIHQGRNSAGVDCAGLVLKVGEALGFECGDMQGYKRHPDALKFLNHIRSQTTLCDVAAPGRIAIFRQSRFPCHTGIFTMKNGVLHFIHSFIVTGGVTEQPFTHEWPGRLVEVRAYRDRV